MLANSKLTIRYLSETEYDRWNQFVAASSTGSIYSTTTYLDALCAATGGRFRLLSVSRGDELLGGVALYEEIKSYGRFVAGRLLLYYNGIVLKDLQLKSPSEQTSRYLAVLTALMDELNTVSYGRVVLRNRHGIADVRPFVDNGWSARPSYSYVVDISDLECAWRLMDQNQRRLVERCRDKGIRCTADDDFESFYDMHLETHQRKGAPLYLPKAAFRRYFQKLREQNLCRLYFARLDDGRPVAVQLVLLGDHPVTHTVCAAADAEFLRLGTTPFLRWSVFEELSRLGYRANDLTDAAINPVTRFKSQLGGELVCNMVLKRPDKFMFVCAEKFVTLAKTGLRAPRWVYRRVRNSGN